MKKIIAVVAILFCVSTTSFAKEKLSPSDFNLGDLGTRVQKVESEVEKLKRQVADLTKKVEQIEEKKVVEKTPVEDKPVLVENVKEKPKKFFNNKKPYSEVYNDVATGKKAVVYVGVEHDGFDDYSWAKVDTLNGIKSGVYDCYLEDGKNYMVLRTVKAFLPAKSDCSNGNCPIPNTDIGGGCQNGNCPSPSQQNSRYRLFRW